MLYGKLISTELVTRANKRIRNHFYFQKFININYYDGCGVASPPVNLEARGNTAADSVSDVSRRPAQMFPVI